MNSVIKFVWQTSFAVWLGPGFGRRHPGMSSAVGLSMVSTKGYCAGT